MKKYFDSLINSSGAPVVAASISVYNYGTTTLASLFGDSSGSTTLANPLTSSSAGYFEFYAADGRYTLSISVGGYPVTTITDILLDDPTNASATVVVGGSVDNSPIGASTPSSGAFTTLSASSSVSGTGFVNYMASPPAIGGTAPNTGKFTTLTTTGDASIGGNVGIGAAPATKLDCFNSGTSDTIAQIRNGTTSIQIQSGNGFSYINTYTAHPMLFGVGNAERMRIDSSGNVLVTNSGGGLGYGTGSGGTVTQATSKSTTVTLNKPTGQITMNNAALAAGAFVTFQLTNSVIASTDGVFVYIKNPVSGLANYRVQAGDVGAGYCWIGLQNVSAGSLSDAAVIGFSVIKGSNA